MRMFKLALASLFALLALGASVQSAQAYDLSISPGGAASATGTLTFSDGGGLVRYTCTATFNETFVTGSVPFASGSQIGTIDSVGLRGCTGGTFVALTATSWPIVINTVLGTLPSGVTGILVDIPRFAWELTMSLSGIPVTCLYAATGGALIVLTGANPFTTAGMSLLPNTLSLGRGSGLCPATARFNGSFAISPSQVLTAS